MPLNASLLDALRSAHKKALIGTAVAATSVFAAAATYAMWPEETALPAAAVAIVEEGASAFTPVVLAPQQRMLDAGHAAADRNAILGDPVRLTRALQSELARTGCYTGPMNGRWTTRTRQAMVRLLEIANARLPAHGPDAVLLALAEAQPDSACRATSEVATHHERREEPLLQETAARASASPIFEADPYARAAPGRAIALETGSIERATRESEVEPVQAGVIEADTIASAAALTATAAATSTPLYAEPSKPRAERQRTAKKRKRYKKQPSLARTFRSIQRSLNKLF